MRKIKKVFAVLLTLAMVLGMSMTTMATGIQSIDIPVNGAGTGASYQSLQLILPDSTTATGWKFNSDVSKVVGENTITVLKNFQDAMGANLSEQDIIWKLIAKVEANNSNIPTGVTPASENNIEKAIANVANTGYSLTTGKTATTAGIYYIKATEAGYAYNPMMAYVSFGYVSGVPTTLTSTGVSAKRSEITTTKSSSEADKITEIGRVETYYVGSVVPFVPLSDDNRYYKVKDSISGAEYVTENNKVSVNVYYGKTVEDVKTGNSTADKIFTADVSSDADGKKTFTADLTEVLSNNTYANQSIVITYQAKVTDVMVGNDVKIGNGTPNGESLYGFAHEDLYTGGIEIEKVDEKDITIKLSEAGFIFSKTVGESTKYAKFNNSKFVEWVDSEADATEVFTNDQGKLEVSGLDAGTYHVTEKTAPEGYSIRAGIEDAVITLGEGQTVATSNLKVSYTGDKAVKDTKLSALPSTGGIGTTIFTIGGCAIMIIAAALFFASRRKSAK